MRLGHSSLVNHSGLYISSSMLGLAADAVRYYWRETVAAKQPVGRLNYSQVVAVKLTEWALQGDWGGH
jgi:hypothetical protein